MATRVLLVFLGMVAGIMAFPLDGEYQDIVNALQSRLYGGRMDPHDLPARQRGYEDWKLAFAKQDDEKMLEPVDNNEVVDIFNGRFEVVDDWPEEELNIGQVGGLAVDAEGHPNVFHRGDREWNATTFNDDFQFTEKQRGPIAEPAFIRFNKTNGAVIDKWGAGMFYLPHGLTICEKGHFWVTDVAMHQVFKFEKGADKPALTLGKAFEPASGNDDEERLCQPTDVAVASNGDFFVADGYCNSRVIKYNADGKIMGIFGVGDFEIAHSISLVEDLDMVCVADREGMRILCYNADLDNNGDNDLGLREREYPQYDDNKMGRIFAIDYSIEDGLMYAVTGQTGPIPSMGFSIDMHIDEGRYRDDIVAMWEPDEQGFDQPHDLAVSPDGENIYVGEIGPNVVWKFQKEEQ